MKKMAFLLCLNILFIQSFIFAQPEKRIKLPDVTGMFYPKDKSELSALIDSFLNNPNIPQIKENIAGMVSPHAGYIYSGPVAAYGYKNLSNKNYKTVVILAPSHRQFLDKIAVYKSGAFRTPLGDVEIDDAFTSQLISLNKNIADMPAVFDNEHSLEVQIPFLQRVLSGFKIVPLIIGSDSYALCKSLAQTLTKAIGGRNDILIIASSDMSHFHNQNKAKIIDENTLKSLKELNPEKLFQESSSRTTELCGLGAVVSLMLTMQELDKTNIEVLTYATSYDTTGTSKDRVVGYSSIIFSAHKKLPAKKEGSKKMLSDLERKKLLEIARNSIVEFVKNNRRIGLKETDPALLEAKGAFVTITENGQLRGCIGHIVADTPLAQTIADMAIEAAIRDPRFPPLNAKELDDISLEISVLSPLELIDDVNKIEVGKHGLLIRKGFYSGLLLPQVATEYNWNREEFLQHTCRKAGLGPNEWKKNAQIYIFSAEVFGEKER